ncbi:MAG TPA: hypothetical protein VF008_09885 [Niastella sp.]
MPNRILRDWTDSERVNELNAQEERFFTRLIMKADDFGCYYAHTSLLKANLFPLLLNEVREADISRWMAACQKAGLIALYEFNSKKYLQILDFKQRLDKARAKFPLPSSGNPITTDNVVPAEAESEADIETEVETEEEVGASAHPPELVADFEKFQEWLTANAPRVKSMKEPFTIEKYLEIKENFPAAKIAEILTAMHNWEPLLKKNRNAYLTAIKWLKKESDGAHQKPNSGGASGQLGTSEARVKKAKEY